MIEAVKRIFQTTVGKDYELTRPTEKLDDPKSHEYYIAKEFDYGCHGPMALPYVFCKGDGVYLHDVTGKRYLDFMSSFGAVNQGHCHPKIRDVMIDQMNKLTLTCVSGYNDKLGPTYEFMCGKFGFQKVHFANGGVEAVEHAVLLARRWGYEVKKVKDGKARILFPHGAYWGRSIAARAGQDHPEALYHFGPFGLNFSIIPYDDPDALEKELKGDSNIVAYLFEPIQGEGGIRYPQEGYLKRVRELCTKYNVLMIADEIQTGLGRTGKLKCCDWEGVRPDIMTIGKSLSGGFYPISACFADKDIMDLINPGEAMTTYGGNPLAAVIAKRSIEVLYEEGLIDNALELGKHLEKELRTFNHKFIKDIRAGKGLYAGIELDSSIKAFTVATRLAEKGLISHPASTVNVIRIHPPLCITKEQLDEGLRIIRDVFDNLYSVG